MKKLFFLATCLCASVAMFAAELVDVAIVNQFRSGETYKTCVSAYDKSFENTDGITLVLNNVNNGQKDDNWTVMRCGRKGNASVATIETKSALKQAIKTVVIDFTQVYEKSVNALYLEVASNAQFTDAEKITATIAVGEVRFPIAKPAADKFYRISIDCKADEKSNGFVRFQEIDFIYESELVAATAITLDATELTLGQYHQGALQAKLTPADANNPIVWTSSDPAVATVSEGVISALTAGETTITATAGTVSATCKVTVTAAPTPMTATYAQGIALAGVEIELEGYVVGIYQEWSDQYKNISVYIADDKAASTGLLCFRAAPLDKETLPIAKQGDKLRVKGTTDIYNGTVQLAQGCTYEILVEDTAVEDVTMDTHSTRKVIENGQVYIIRDGVRYNALGAVVRK